MCGIRTHDPGLQESLRPFATVTGSMLINDANNTMLRNPPPTQKMINTDAPAAQSKEPVDLTPSGQLQKHPGATFHRDIILMLFQFNF
jgi:hypothetical protein